MQKPKAACFALLAGAVNFCLKQCRVCLILDGAVMGYKYSGALKEMLHKLKFEGESKFLQPLAEEAVFLAQVYSESCFDMVVSVPTDAARRKPARF